MEPAFHRGDILFLHMGYAPFRAGDIVVFKVADREIPIVHRVIKVRVSGPKMAALCYARSLYVLCASHAQSIGRPARLRDESICDSRRLSLHGVQ
jgi:hypothetical protein